MEVDDLGPIQTSIDEADRSAFRAAKMDADIMPVPVRKIVQIEPAVVVTVHSIVADYSFA
jgi:hypothetical protein